MISIPALKAILHSVSNPYEYRDNINLTPHPTKSPYNLDITINYSQ